MIKNLEILDYLIKNIENKVNIYILSSSTIKYIANPRDIDICIVIDEPDKEKFWDLKRKIYRDLKIKFNYHEYNLCIKILNKETFIKNNLFYGYNLHYCILYNEKDNLNIEYTLKDIIKNEFIFKEEAIKYLKTFCFDYKQISQMKEWYHIYIVKSIIENNSYDLTEEQIKNVNILHDIKEEDLLIRKELISECINWLNTTEEEIFKKRA